MQDTKGKVVLSLLAGATAGIVAGLLLAPETGDETRADIKKSASKFTDDLSKLLKEGLARFSTGKEATGQHDTDRSAADNLLSSLDSPGGQAQSVTASFDDLSSANDGIGGDAHQAAGDGPGL